MVVHLNWQVPRRYYPLRTQQDTTSRELSSSKGHLVGHSTIHLFLLMPYLNYILSLRNGKWAPGPPFSHKHLASGNAQSNIARVWPLYPASSHK